MKGGLPSLNLVDRKRARQLAICLDLLLKRGEFGLGGCNGVGAREKTKGRVLFARDLEQRLVELYRIAALLPVLGRPPLPLSSGALGIFLDMRLGVAGRFLGAREGADVVVREPSRSFEAAWYRPRLADRSSAGLREGSQGIY